MAPPVLKLKYVASFNGTAEGSGFITASKAGLTYTIGADFRILGAESGTFIPAAYILPLQAVADGTFVKITAADFLSQSQPLDPTLSALAALDSTPGLLEQTGADAFAKRAMGAANATDVLTRADGDGRYHPLITTALAVSLGGTGLSSYTIGDLIYASGAATLSKLADVATGNVLLSGGVGAAPSYGKVDLTAHVTGSLGPATIAMGADNTTGLTLKGASGNNRLTLGTDASSNVLLRSQNSGDLRFGVDSTTWLTINNAGTVAAAGAFSGATTGVADASSAAAGQVGEYVSAILASGSAVSLTTATPANITSISLTAGDWDVWINTRFTGGAATTVTSLTAAISAVSATLETTPARIANTFHNGQTPFASVNLDIATGPTRVSVASTTTIYLVAQAVFGTSTCSAYGALQARRRR